MRFKLRFLKRLEVKLAHLVCLLLSKTRQNLPPPPLSGDDENQIHMSYI